MNHRIHFKLSWSVQQILSHPEKLILLIEESSSTQYANWLSYAKNGIDCRLFAVMNCLHIFDGEAINESIFTQQHITTF